MLFAQVEPVESLGQWFSAMCAELTIGRTQIAMEQVRTAAADPEQLLVVSARSHSGDNTPLAALVAILPTVSMVASGADTATVVHASRLPPAAGKPQHTVDDSELARALGNAFESELRSRNARFVQWVTDAQSVPASPSRNWPAIFGFQDIGTLSYLCGTVPPNKNANCPRQIYLQPVQWNQQQLPTSFSRLVEQTYQQSLDCPALSAFRSVEQVLSGYQAQLAFDPNLWFTACNRRGDAIGCAIFGLHGGPDAASSASPHDGDRSLEIVYMGIVPAARGRGVGAEVVSAAFQTARQIGAGQVLLAVDQRNFPAMSIYQQAGLRNVIDERVWVKSVSST